MSDLRAKLERSSERISPRPDAFEQLERARRLRSRNRRVTATVVALVIGTAGTFGVVTAFSGSDRSTPAAVSPSTFHALWPEQTLTAARSTQAEVDAGDPSLSWRKTAEVTAARFALRALGWEATGTDVRSRTRNSPDSFTFVLIGCHAGADCGRPVPTESVTVERLVQSGAGGIWSVTQVTSPWIKLPLQVGDEVPGHSRIQAPMDMGTLALLVTSSSKDLLLRHIASAYAYVGSCGSIGVSTQELLGNLLSFRVATAQSGCNSPGQPRPPTGPGRPVNGYVYVVERTQKTAGLDFLDLFTSRQFPRSGWVTAVSAVPVRFVPAKAVPSKGQAPASPSPAGFPGGSPPPCEPRQLRLVLADDGAGGGLVPSVSAERISGPDCMVNLDVTLTIENRVGNALQIRGNPATGVIEGSTAGSKEAIPSWWWQNWCGGRGPSVYVARAGALESRFVERSATPRCDAPNAPSTLRPLKSMGYTSPYPRGAFDWCANLAGTLDPLVPDGSYADLVAVRFDRALVQHRTSVIRRLTDPCVPHSASGWVATRSALSVREVSFETTPQSVRYGCGPEVARRTIAVVVADGSSASSSRTVTFYLVLRPYGWRVWASN